MNLIKPSWKIIDHVYSESGVQQDIINNIYKSVELAGRTCYLSYDKITPDSAKDFANRMINSGHGAMLEHGTVYLKVPYSEHGYSDDEYGYKYKSDCIGDYAHNKYSKLNTIWDDITITAVDYVTTNLRVLVENNWLSDLQYVCEPTEHHEKRIMVKFISDIHFYKDTTRHRVFSWAIESTRLCNYIKQKFGSSISFATPIWLKEDETEEFENDLKIVEGLYFKWLNKGWQPQQAAYFLIQGTKAEIVMTGFVSDYIHFFDLRSEDAKTGKAHPSVVELVEPLKREFIKRNYI